MRRVLWLVPLLSVFLAVGTAASSCSTYRADLDRAKTHYEQNQYEAALAIFRVLEPDSDSFAPSELAQYAYLRGMTDYRLSSLAAAGTNVKDPKKDFRNHARHWLGVAAAVEKDAQGGLTEDEKKRLSDTLADLNHDVYGGAEVADADAGIPSADAGKK